MCFLIKCICVICEFPNTPSFISITFYLKSHEEFRIGFFFPLNKVLQKKKKNGTLLVVKIGY